MSGRFVSSLTAPLPILSVDRAFGMWLTYCMATDKTATQQTFTRFAVASADKDYSALTPHDLVEVTTGGADRTVTLPAIGGQFAPVGTRITITKVDAGTAFKVTIAAAAGNTILGGATDSTLLPASKVNQAELEAIGTSWNVVMRSYAP